MVFSLMMAQQNIIDIIMLKHEQVDSCVGVSKFILTFFFL